MDSPKSEQPAEKKEQPDITKAEKKFLRKTKREFKDDDGISETEQKTYDALKKEVSGKGQSSLKEIENTLAKNLGVAHLSDGFEEKFGKSISLKDAALLKDAGSVLRGEELAGARDKEKEINTDAVLKIAEKKGFTR